MADIYFPLTDSRIDYSLKDGRVRMFRMNGIVLHDENISSVPGWKEILATFVVSNELYIDSGSGLHAFVNKMIKDGLIKEGSI